MSDNLLENNASIIAAIIDTADEVILESFENVEPAKPRLLVEHCDPQNTVFALTEILADSGELLDRGGPVRLVKDQVQGGVVAWPLSSDAAVLLAHRMARPYLRKIKSDGTVVEVNTRLPRNIAVMYIENRGHWGLQPLNGIASGPLLRESGDLYDHDGYDPLSGMWLEHVPSLVGCIPQHPSRQDAERALSTLRFTFRTFCFGDADMIHSQEVSSVDQSKPPGVDESAFLVALLTAVCRASLHLAPGVLLRAASISGAGAGKGLLARCICSIAFGREPHAVTAGGGSEELEKRIAAELIQAGPILFLDNLNNTTLKSNLLASAITERPARVRLLGRSEMVPLNSAALVLLTGNGLSVSEDLARRFICVELDPRTEDPEARRFPNDVFADVKTRRNELLAATLTIWRWGRLEDCLPQGQPLGSFAQWCRWVRDPLLALGCRDPAERIKEAKANDSNRQKVVDLYSIWLEKHGLRPVTVRDLDESVKQIVDPQGRGRQSLSAYLQHLAGTRIAGLVLTRQKAPGKHGAATYALCEAGETGSHRVHRGHTSSALSNSGPNRPNTSDAPDATDGFSGTVKTEAQGNIIVRPGGDLVNQGNGLVPDASTAPRNRWREPL